MGIDILREKLHALIDNSSKEKLQEIYNLLEESDYTDKFKKQLEEEYAAYEKDDTVISKEEIDKLVEELIHGKK
jgi:predicted house-cleaning noncanonical NTP pyrophosphatase (MazG superfamily)